MKYILILFLLLTNNLQAINSSSTRGVTEVIGIAKESSVNGTFVTFDFYIENFGTIALNSVIIVDDLDAVFGSGNYVISSPPVLIDDPGTISLNGGFNGSGDTNLLVTSSSINSTDTARIQFVVEVVTTTDQGSGFGLYFNQATIFATGITTVSDISDSGNDPDPNGNGDPTEVGENDSTPIDLSTTPVELLNFEID